MVKTNKNFITILPSYCSDELLNTSTLTSAIVNKIVIHGVQISSCRTSNLKLNKCFITILKVPKRFFFLNRGPEATDQSNSLRKLIQKEFTRYFTIEHSVYQQ